MGEFQIKLRSIRQKVNKIQHLRMQVAEMLSVDNQTIRGGGLK